MIAITAHLPTDLCDALFDDPELLYELPSPDLARVKAALQRILQDNEMHTADPEADLNHQTWSLLLDLVVARSEFLNGTLDPACDVVQGPLRPLRTVPIGAVLISGYLPRLVEHFLADPAALAGLNAGEREILEGRLRRAPATAPITALLDQLTLLH